MCKYTPFVFNHTYIIADDYNLFIIHQIDINIDEQ